LPSDRPPVTGGLSLTEEAAKLQASGVVVSLAREADRQELSVADQVTLREADLREWMANKVVPLFLKANRWTLIALGVLVLLDEINLAVHLMKPSDRIINAHVIMTLLGATTVQVGAIAATIARYLFPGRRP
jgi:hypothetical protein